MKDENLVKQENSPEFALLANVESLTMIVDGGVSKLIDDDRFESASDD